MTSCDPIRAFVLIEMISVESVEIDPVLGAMSKVSANCFPGLDSTGAVY